MPSSTKRGLKIVLDTNVWVSTLLWGGKPAAIIEAAEQGKVNISISEDIVTEISQVLTYPKLQRVYRATKLRKEDLIEQVLKTAKFVKVANKVEVIHEHTADNKFIECALAAKADYIVSGDGHVLRVDAYRKIKMLNASDFLKLIE